MQQSEFFKSLKNPKTYDSDLKEIKVLQTHISYVALTKDYAYKIKKPVNFGFLDFSSLEKRKDFCKQEIKLNKRLCPEIYLDVIKLTKKDNGLEINGSGEIIDYAVKMKKFDQKDIMTNKLEKNKITEEDINRIIKILVDFYKKEKRTKEIDEFGKTDLIKTNTDENFTQTENVINKTISKQKFEYIKKQTNKFLKEKNQVFEKRIKNKYICDCHGDLHSGNIVVTQDSICIFDCIEFNKRFRYSDIASDVAFLAMDLDYLGHPYLSSHLVKKYIEKSKDKNILQVLNFYKCYRAYVRGKVIGFKLEDPNIEKEEKHNTLEIAKKYFDLAYYYAKLFSLELKQGQPTLFITSGLTGTGKTTISNKISVDYNAQVISTDMMRKKLEGMDVYERHHDAYNTGLYSPEKMLMVYEQILKDAEKNLNKGRNVVLDATFKTKKLRDDAKEIAKKTHSNFIVLNTVCPENIVKNYLEQRVKKKSVSDGRWEIYVKQKDTFEDFSSDKNMLEIDVSKKNYDYQINVFSKLYEKIQMG